MQDSGLAKTDIAEIVMVGGSTRIPKVQELIQEFFNGKELCKTINPDEAVAYGAAVQAAIVSGQGTEEVQNMLLLDVAPLSLGLETAGGIMQVLIPRNTTLPTEKSQDFTTFEDYQDHVEIKVYEGERGTVKDNNYLGSFTMKDIPKALRGAPKIKVTFSIDTNGILEIKAEDVQSKKKNTIKIENEKGRLTQDQLEGMLAEAEQYKGEDEISKGDLIAKQELKVFATRTRKALDDLDAAKVREKDRVHLRKKLDDLEVWLDDKAGLKAGREEFQGKQRELESCMTAIMMRINQGPDFWEQQVAIHEGEKTIAQGGFLLESGLDIRELIEDPQ